MNNKSLLFLLKGLTVAVAFLSLYFCAMAVLNIELSNPYVIEQDAPTKYQLKMACKFHGINASQKGEIRNGEVVWYFICNNKKCLLFTKDCLTYINSGGKKYGISK